MAHKYNDGDVLNVTKLRMLGTVGYGVLVIMHTGLDLTALSSPTYHVKHISGNLEFGWINCRYFDREAEVIKIGNIYKDKTLKVLYGS